MSRTQTPVGAVINACNDRVRSFNGVPDAEGKNAKLTTEEAKRCSAAGDQYRSPMVA